MTVFGLPFVACSCFMIHWVGSLCILGAKAAKWVQVDARISSVTLEQSKGGKGTSFEAVCAYEYSYQGIPHLGKQVGLYTGSDSVGSWQKDTYDRLNAAFERGETVPCYVAPEQPDRAVLDRDLRWGQLGLLLAAISVFAVAGCGLTACGIYNLRDVSRLNRGRREHPDEPWRWRKEWATGRISAGTKLGALVTWGLAIFWNGISLPVLFLVFSRALSDIRQVWMLVFLIFPLIGAGLLIEAVRRTILHFKYGQSYFELRTVPGTTGGVLQGNLVLEGRLRELQVVDVALTCCHRIVTGRGKGRSTRRTALWEDKQHFDSVTVFSENQGTIPVSFRIPDDLPPSDDSKPDEAIEWILKATAGLPGVDLDLEFEVPVFRLAHGARGDDLGTEASAR